MNASNLAETWSGRSHYFQSLLRIMAALSFISTGTMKLFAFPPGMPPNGGTARLFSQVGIVGILEVFGGALILIGWLTHPVSFVIGHDGRRLLSIPRATELLARRSTEASPPYFTDSYGFTFQPRVPVPGVDAWRQKARRVFASR